MKCSYTMIKKRLQTVFREIICEICKLLITELRKREKEAEILDIFKEFAEHLGLSCTYIKILNQSKIRNGIFRKISNV